MFRIHDRTRRMVCRVAFIGLCLLPLAAIVLWGAWRHSPAHADAAARALTEQLGLKVGFSRIEHIQPGRLRYHDFVLTNPETGRPVLTCARAEVDITRQPATQIQLALKLQQPLLDASGLAVLGQLLSRTMQRQTAARAVELHVRADELQLEGPGGVFRMVQCEGTLQPHPGGSRAQWQFHLPGEPTSEPLHIELARNRQTDPPSTAVRLFTAGAALPCPLLAEGIPPLNRLGPAARFRGYLRATETADGWSGELSGQFLDLEMARLVDDHFAHTLRGPAEVTVEAARFRDGRLQEAVGSLIVGPGVVGQALLESAVEQLELVQNVQPSNTANDVIRFEQLGVAWRLGPQGLTLEGRCPVGGPGTILIDRRQRLLGEPVAQPQPIAALIRVLVDDRGQRVPAQPASQWLLRRLPIDAADEPAVTARRAR